MTTRIPELLASHGVAVKVDRMFHNQARALLAYYLARLYPALAEGPAGGGRAMVASAGAGQRDLANASPAAKICQKPGGSSMTGCGQTRRSSLITSCTWPDLDHDRPEIRARVGRATIEASTSPLDPGDADRFAELAVFVEDDTIPFSLAARLWRAAAGLDVL